MGIKQTTVSAFENTPESTKLDTLFKLLAALDFELHVQPRNSNAETQSSNQQWNEEW